MSRQHIDLIKTEIEENLSLEEKLILVNELDIDYNQESTVDKLKCTIKAMEELVTNLEAEKGALKKEIKSLKLGNTDLLDSLNSQETLAPEEMTKESWTAEEIMKREA